LSTLAEILEQMAVKVREVTDTITDVDIQVESGIVINPTAPCIDIYPADPSMDPSVGGFGDIDGAESITVRARVSTADSDAGQELLLAFMDDEDELSLAAALADDPTLNGMADLSYQGRGGYALFPTPQGDGALLGCLFTFTAIKMYS
jgi:hypothetical protein